MHKHVRRVYVEKKKGYDIEARQLLYDLKENLGIAGLQQIRIINCYDVAGIAREEYEKAINSIFSEPNVDNVYLEKLDLPANAKVFAVEYLPGQYDQRGDSAAQCIQILTRGKKPVLRTSRIVVIYGEITENELKRIKNYCINPVDSREGSLVKPDSLVEETNIPDSVKIIEGFTQMKEGELAAFLNEMGFAMGMENLQLCQQYFRCREKRDPTITELKVIDTYWSDHCRHTTFMTEFQDVDFEKGEYTQIIKNAYHDYLRSREYVYDDGDRPQCLMDIATIAMKQLRKMGRLDDVEVSEEKNACSIVVEVDVNGKNEQWLVMFKNETHNHPTEIEPFGGAATCLGGAIRDPLSGRAYVYQAMRVTGSGDPRTRIEHTLPGKLPQRKITTEAARGYSSYGNQIGVATGQVAEIYDRGYIAKRMEIGAVIGAVPKSNVVRETPQEGDLVILVGGRTGRDGCGGATGSSKEHTAESLFTCSAEVQKGNPPTERKIQRLFRRPEVSKLIKKCNDFGAGGVSVAIGELADSLEIYLDKVPRKYEGLDGTELAISESQERMAVVIGKDNVAVFQRFADEENLEATVVAKVTADGRLRMIWKDNAIVDISRKFLATNGVRQKIKVLVTEPDPEQNYFKESSSNIREAGLSRAWLDNLKELNVAGQKGLVERFDSTVGAGSVIAPFGGKYQLSPSQGMAARIPVLDGETNSCTIMTYGFNPGLAKWSPFHGGLYAILASISKIVAMGGDYRRTRLTLQEYFEKLGRDERKWGKPFSALLGAYYIQNKLGVPAIGGKDSMSGTYNDLNVPPTLVSFAVDVAKMDKIVSTEFKKPGSRVVLVPVIKDEYHIPDFEILKKNYVGITSLTQYREILAASVVEMGGIAGAVSKMAFGNKLGILFNDNITKDELFAREYGAIILEVDRKVDLDRFLYNYKVLGHTQEEPEISIGNTKIDLDTAIQAWQEPLNHVFPVKQDVCGKPEKILYSTGNRIRNFIKVGKPRVFVPVFPGTNCEYDTVRAFEVAGGKVNTLVFRNLTSQSVEESIVKMAEEISQSQIIALPGGFSAGDEPEGAGKFIATVFRNMRIKEAVMDLLRNRDGLIIGICNGFQALIKLGLVPYGEIREPEKNSPTLTYNKIGRHVSTIVRTKIVSNLSPWFNNVKVGDIHTVPVSHGEGRFVANDEEMKKMIKNGQVAAQYVDIYGEPSYDGFFNPNGSMNAVEAITSPDGRVLGKMAHSERTGKNLLTNIPGVQEPKIFEAGINYFR